MIIDCTVLAPVHDSTQIPIHLVQVLWKFLLPLSDTCQRINSFLVNSLFYHHFMQCACLHTGIYVLRHTIYYNNLLYIYIHNGVNKLYLIIATCGVYLGGAY